MVNHPAWLANDAQSQWIGAVANGTTNAAAGDYTFETTFNLDAWDHTTAQVTIDVAVDNTLTALSLNAVLVDFTAAGFSSFVGTVVLDDGFVPGENTLEFVTNNCFRCG